MEILNSWEAFPKHKSAKKEASFYFFLLSKAKGPILFSQKSSLEPSQISTPLWAVNFPMWLAVC